MEGLEHETDVGTPQPGHRPTDSPVTFCPSSQISPPLGRSSKPSMYSNVDFPQPAGPHHRHRLPARDIQFHPVNRVGQARIPAVILAQPASTQHAGPGVRVVHDSPFWLVVAFERLQPVQVRLQSEQCQAGRWARRQSPRMITRRSRYASRRLSTQNVMPIRTAASTTKMPVSMPWKAQNRLAG
jgi:hypothetical protein